MKKNLVRVLAFVLVLILALGVIPLGALAVDVNVDGNVYGKQNPTTSDVFDNITGFLGNSNPSSVTIKTSNYPGFIENVATGAGFDLKGVVDSSVFGTPNKKLDPKSSVTFTQNGSATLIYTPHQHGLSYWYSDNTTHWRECLVCKKYHASAYERFMYQNWHSDGDEDRVCDVCGHDIPYHDIDVEEVKGGKITVELNEAPHRKKIVATAEPDEGYKLKKIHFIKVRTNGTEQEITRRKTSTKGTWWAYMPTYDLKVTAEFVKKK